MSSFQDKLTGIRNRTISSQMKQKLEELLPEAKKEEPEE